MRRRDFGFSLVELLVAITLALVLTAAVVSVFVGSRTAYQATSGVAALTDGGRFALNFIEGSGVNAGYIACTQASLPAEQVINSRVVLGTTQDILNNATGTLAYDFRAGVGGYEAAGTGSAGTATVVEAPSTDGSTGDWTPSLDAAFAASSATQVKGSDVVVFRSSLEAAPAYVTADIAQGANSIPVNNASGLKVGEIAALSDCTKAIPFEINSIASGATATISFAGASAGGPGNTGATLAYPFDAGALVQALTTSVYYIGVGSDGDGALKRLDLNGANGPGQFTDEELVPDIENMQVLYGIDNPPGSLTPSQYVTADQVPDWDEVVSVRVALLAAAPPGSGSGPAVTQTYDLLGTTVTAPTDNRLRRVFETTITLRNAVD